MMSEKEIAENTKKVFSNVDEINCIKVDKIGKKVCLKAYMANGLPIKLSNYINELFFDFNETFAFIKEKLKEDSLKFTLIYTANGIVNKNNIRKISSINAKNNNSIVVGLFKGNTFAPLFKTKTKTVNNVVEKLSKSLNLSNELEKQF